MKLKLFSAIIVLAVAAVVARAEDVVGRPIESWQPGMLDIHQISTERGNAGLYIFPDGTTLLVDAGELPGQNPKHTPARPDGTRGAGEWVVRYVRHALRRDPQPALDYVLLTHFHQDHMGEVATGMPVSPHGYTLTGVTRVVEDLKVGKLLDRGWPIWISIGSISNAGPTRHSRRFPVSTWAAWTPSGSSSRPTTSCRTRFPFTGWRKARTRAAAQTSSGMQELVFPNQLTAWMKLTDLRETFPLGDNGVTEWEIYGKDVE